MAYIGEPFPLVINISSIIYFAHISNKSCCLERHSNNEPFPVCPIDMRKIEYQV